MSADAYLSDKELCQRWQGGDSRAASLLYSRFTGRLLDLLQNRLAGRVRSRIDPESVMHSALKSLLLRTDQGQFDFVDDGDVWRLLVTISLNKVRNRVRDAQAARRDVRREIRSSEIEFDAALANCLVASPGEEETMVFAELVESLLNRLSPVNQEIVRFRLEGLSPDAIGLRLSEPLTSRSVNRRLNGEILRAVNSLIDDDIN